MMSFVWRLTVSLGVYRSPKVRFLLRIWNSAPNPPCYISSPRRHGFCRQCLCDPNHDSDLGPISSILQAREKEISHVHDGEDPREAIF